MQYLLSRDHQLHNSQMTAVKVMDVISILPGCAGQAASAVSAYNQVKIPKSRHLDTSAKKQMA